MEYLTDFRIFLGISDDARPQQRVLHRTLSHCELNHVIVSSFWLCNVLLNLVQYRFKSALTTKCLFTTIASSLFDLI